MTEPEWQSHGFIPGFPVSPSHMNAAVAYTPGSPTVINKANEQFISVKEIAEANIAESRKALKGLGEELDRSRRLALAALWVSSLGLAVFLFDLLVILIRH
jgi:hypothetical protein